MQSSDRTPSVEVRHLCKTYATRRGNVEALRDVGFEIGAAEFVSLVGPSGCGKSTVLKIVAGLESYSDGHVTVAGAPVTAGRSDVGIMFQSPVLLPWRTVLANVLLPTEVFKQPRETAREHAAALLDLVGLDGFADKYPFELSGGMQQRVSLARLLVFKPSILLMDEPFAALDEFTRERLNQELIDIHEQSSRSVMYVTHNISEAVVVSDRVVVMKPRPGEVLEVVDIGLPRPRSVDLIDSDQASQYVRRIRRKLKVG